MQIGELALDIRFDEGKLGVRFISARANGVEIAFLNQLIECRREVGLTGSLDARERLHLSRPTYYKPAAERP